MPKHIEVPALARANALIAEIDSEEGWLRAGVNVGLGPHIDLAPAVAWVANPVGEPPPGVTRTWDEPLTHPTQPARFSVQVTDAQMADFLIGRQPQGFPGPIQAQHAVERGPEWFVDEQQGQEAGRKVVR